MSDITLIPHVCGAGATIAGSEYGPLYCQEHQIEKRLEDFGIRAKWAVQPQEIWGTPAGELAHQKLGPRGSQNRLETVRWHIQKTADLITTHVQRGERCLGIGGDHSMAAGSLAGARLSLGTDKTVGLIWVDAHPDIQTTITSVSKSLHGMPMATLLGLDATLQIKSCTYPVFTPEKMLYAGLRSIDPEEIDNAHILNMSLEHLNALRDMGLKETLKTRMSALKSRCDHILLSIDLDSFSGALAPAVGSPVPEGFQKEEILPLLCDLIDTHSVPFIEIVEFNPTLPGADRTYAFMLDICRELLAPKKS